MKEINKIFGIGFQKTGTTSLRDAFFMLGYSVCDGCDNAMNPNIESEIYSICYKLVEQYDAFEDHPWSVLYKDLDNRYPNSKFILTIRPTDKWIKSVSNHFQTNDIPLHKWIYGVGYPIGNENIWIDRYEKHNAEVIEYFKDRPNDLLVLKLDGSINQEQIWNSLCVFLNHPVSKRKFPHRNSRQSRIIGDLFLNKLRHLIYKLYGKQPINFLGIKIGKNLTQQ